MTKDSGLRIRVQRDLRDRFLEVSGAGQPAAQVIREFMRDYVERHQDAEGTGTHNRKRQGLAHEH